MTVSLFASTPTLRTVRFAGVPSSFSAGVAQWQSTCFVNRWLQVRLPSPAHFFPTPRVRAPPDLISTAWWCNGSTADSDSACLGSSPSRAAIFDGAFVRLGFAGVKTGGRFGRRWLQARIDSDRMARIKDANFFAGIFRTPTKLPRGFHSGGVKNHDGIPKQKICVRLPIK